MSRLVLALQAERSFYLGDRRVEVLGITAPNTVKVKVHGPIDEVKYLTDRELTELIPDCYAQIGIGTGPNTIKIVIEAPREVHILRDTLYDQQKIDNAAQGSAAA